MSGHLFSSSGLKFGKHNSCLGMPKRNKVLYFLEPWSRSRIPFSFIISPLVKAFYIWDGVGGSDLLLVPRKVGVSGRACLPPTKCSRPAAVPGFSGREDEIRKQLNLNYETASICANKGGMCECASSPLHVCLCVLYLQFMMNPKKKILNYALSNNC